MRALLVNDDGYKSAGIRALQKELAAHYEVKAIAPADEQSWKGKSISASHQPLTMLQVKYHEFDGYAVNGTPADCTQLGLFELHNSLPDLVVSGINNGANIGHAHIMSSGTVGAALEAAFQGVPAFAASVWRMKNNNKGVDFHSVEATKLFATPALISRQIIDKVMAAGFPTGVQVIAINMRYDVAPDAKWFVTEPHRLPYGKVFHKEEDQYLNRGDNELVGHEAPGSDLDVIAQGHVSIVPISVELTTEAGRQQLAQLLNIPIFNEK